ncbi:hypothetical protein D4764_10G0010580 [Takifugu flavidus]|uniref:Uncharacterized protein n=1 Tax=Takifugu flavidus TaxID=433684 RepID=A0A5C6PMT3_9TELE|nr:hypothetical protein D4764_10G0010580 [Takifugu flavidus]
MQALNGDVMPLWWCPCNDFSSSVALFDPDTPKRPSQQIPVPIGLLRTTVTEIWTGRTETERVKTEGSEFWSPGSQVKTPSSFRDMPAKRPSTLTQEV